MALDFVSLVLSKHAPGPAGLTMSEFIKQNLPMGSLGAETVEAPQVSETENLNHEMVSMGWRMQSLTGAADSLLKSASRLEEEMGRETTYWDQVLTVKEEGWSLCRLPREKHTLGVRYGFAEAYADFRDRGLAALRRDEEGNLSLDRGLKAGRYRRLRVRILQRGAPIASSTVKKQNSEGESSATAKQILQARDSIFDEELQHEIHREARNLLSQDVRCKGSRVLIPFERDKQVEVDLVDVEEVSEDAHLESHIASDTMIIALRLLLSQAHRQNLRNRSQIPPPLRGEGTRPRPIYAILTPIVETLSQGQDPISILSKISESSA